MRLASNEVVSGLPWWGARPPSYKKTVCRGRVGREHSSDLMIERVFSNLFFVKHQNLFPQNRSILPIKSIKTLQMYCCIFCMFLKRGVQCRIDASPKFGPPGRGGGEAFVGAPQYCCTRLTIKDKKKLSKSYRKSTINCNLQLQYMT